MGKPRDVQTVAKELWKNFHEAKFGGKAKGRFLMEREQLKSLLGRQQLKDSIVEELQNECLEVGLVMIDLDTRYGFIDVGKVDAWRKVPNTMVPKRKTRVVRDEDESEDLES